MDLITQWTTKKSMPPCPAPSALSSSATTGDRTFEIRSFSHECSLSRYLQCTANGLHPSRFFCTCTRKPEVTRPRRFASCCSKMVSPLAQLIISSSPHRPVLNSTLHWDGSSAILTTYSCSPGFAVAKRWQRHKPVSVVTVCSISATGPILMSRVQLAVVNREWFVRRFRKILSTKLNSPPYGGRLLEFYGTQIMLDSRPVNAWFHQTCAKFCWTMFAMAKWHLCG